MVREFVRKVGNLLRRSVGSREPTVAFLHPGRVGSTVVGTMLGRRPDMHWDAELFEPRRRAKVPEIDQGFAPADVIRVRREKHHGTGYAFAFKPTPSHHLGLLDLDVRGLFEILEDAGVDAFVALRRRNLLRRVVSGAVGRERGSFHQARDDGPVNLTRIRLDPAAVPFGPDQPLLDVFEELERAEDELSSELVDRRHMWLTFEDDIQPGPEIAYEKVCGFLSLPPREQEVPLRRTTPFPLRQVLINYDEVARTLEGTGHEWMLEEGDA